MRLSATLLTGPAPLEGAAVTIERSDASDEDAEKVTEQQAVERRIPPDQPGTEALGLSRADSRAGAEAANEKTTQAADEADTSQSAGETSGEPDRNLAEAEKDDERGAAGAVGDEPSDGSDEEEIPRSGWDAPGVAEDPRRPEVEGIHLTENRRSHILDGEPGGRGGHRHGTGIPRKTEFPAGWDDDTAVGHIVDVARRPDSAEMQDNGRWIVRGERDGVEMDVIVEPEGRIVTAYPLPGGRGVVENPGRRTNG
jgi:hypothetical protein